MKQDKFSNRLKGIRITERLTQAEFAKSIGKNITSIAHWETGRYLPESNVLIKIASLYNINLNWLLLGEGKMHKEPEFEYQVPDHVKSSYSKYPDVKEVTDRYLKIKDSLGEGYEIDVEYKIKKAKDKKEE